MVEKLAKVIAIMICPFLAYGFGVALFRGIAKVGFNHGVTAFVIGFVAFTVIWGLFRRNLELLCTFEHEVTHVIFGLLFLKVPRSFVVTRHEGGHVTMMGGNFLITLAPYFFPTLSYLLLPFSFLVPPKYLPVFLAVLGASVAFHIASTWAELHWQQSDLHKAGIIFSVLFLPAANLIFYGALITLIFGGTAGFLGFWSTGVRESFGLVSAMFKIVF